MGDATHANAGALAAAGPWDAVAGYVTGTPDIRWTAADWAAFPGALLVTIDQASTGSPVPSAIVRDVEPGAWSAAAAVGSGSWTAARPTIYCNQSTLPGVLAAGWRGDLWLAVIGWQPGDPLPAAPGCTVVAVQNAQGIGGLYDRSLLLDPTWPAAADPSNQESDMLVKGSGPGVYMLSGGKMAPVQDQQSLDAIQASGVQLVTVTDATLTAWLAAFPPGNPPVQITVTG